LQILPKVMATRSRLSHILHPYRHFRTPSEVLSSPISTSPKRAILASWALDLYAVESSPLLRQPPGLPEVIKYSDVVNALKELDDMGHSKVLKRPIVPRKSRSLNDQWRSRTGETTERRRE
jgi:hypothetical protein